MHIIFNDLADYLRHGREIEFRYEGKDYSITNCHYEWQFCCDTDGTTIKLCAFHEFDVLVEKIRFGLLVIYQTYTLYKKRYQITKYDRI